MNLKQKENLMICYMLPKEINRLSLKLSINCKDIFDSYTPNNLKVSSYFIVLNMKYIVYKSN